MGSADKKAILVVEDDHDIRELVCDLIQYDLAEFEVLSAVNGQEGLIKVKNHNGNLRLIITDIRMPVMNGEEMLAELDRLGIGKIPRMVMSAHSADSFRGGGKYDIWINKPMSPEQLVSGIKKCLGEIP